MSQGKLSIYGEVLKQTKPFKASTIVMATGLSKQLVSHHLKALIQEGYLERDGYYYCLIARNDLVAEIINVGESKTVGLLPEKPATINVKLVNSLVTTSVMLTGARLPGNAVLKESINKQIDEQIKSWQALKRYLNTKKISETKSVKKINSDFDEIWDLVGKHLRVDKAEFVEALAKRLDDLDL